MATVGISNEANRSTPTGPAKRTEDVAAGVPPGTEEVLASLGADALSVSSDTQPDPHDSESYRKLIEKIKTSEPVPGKIPDTKQYAISESRMIGDFQVNLDSQRGKDETKHQLGVEMQQSAYTFQVSGELKDPKTQTNAGLARQLDTTLGMDLSGGKLTLANKRESNKTNSTQNTELKYAEEKLGISARTYVKQDQGANPTRGTESKLDMTVGEATKLGLVAGREDASSKVVNRSRLSMSQGDLGAELGHKNTRQASSGNVERVLDGTINYGGMTVKGDRTVDSRQAKVNAKLNYAVEGGLGVELGNTNIRFADGQTLASRVTDATLTVPLGDSKLKLQGSDQVNADKRFASTRVNLEQAGGYIFELGAASTRPRSEAAAKALDGKMVLPGEGTKYTVAGGYQKSPSEIGTNLRFAREEGEGETGTVMEVGASHNRLNLGSPSTAALNGKYAFPYQEGKLNIKGGMTMESSSKNLNLGAEFLRAGAGIGVNASVSTKAGSAQSLTGTWKHPMTEAFGAKVSGELEFGGAQAAHDPSWRPYAKGALTMNFRGGVSAFAKFDPSSKQKASIGFSSEF